VHCLPAKGEAGALSLSYAPDLCRPLWGAESLFGYRVPAARDAADPSLAGADAEPASHKSAVGAYTRRGGRLRLMGLKPAPVHVW
jgi:hypothetical protein